MNPLLQIWGPSLANKWRKRTILIIFTSFDCTHCFFYPTFPLSSHLSLSLSHSLTLSLSFSFSYQLNCMSLCRHFWQIITPPPKPRSLPPAKMWFERKSIFFPSLSLAQLNASTQLLFEEKWGFLYQSGRLLDKVFVWNTYINVMSRKNNTNSIYFSWKYLKRNSSANFPKIAIATCILNRLLNNTMATAIA
jgi:hypothetical protein